MCCPPEGQTLCIHRDALEWARVVIRSLVDRAAALARLHTFECFSGDDDMAHTNCHRILDAVLGPEVEHVP